MKDSAVEEVRARRRRLLKERYGGSVDRMIQTAIERQRLHPLRPFSGMLSCSFTNGLMGGRPPDVIAE